jgi:hypothetical protein
MVVRRLQFDTSLNKKVSKTPISTNKPGIVVYTCGPSSTGGIDRRSMVQASLNKNISP